MYIRTGAFLSTMGEQTLSRNLVMGQSVKVLKLGFMRDGTTSLAAE